jgi:endoglucanase
MRRLVYKGFPMRSHLSTHRRPRLGPAQICAVLWLFAAVASGLVRAQAADASTAAARARLLQHGVNASNWFAQANDYSPAHLRSYTTDDDIALMRTMGFDHVRLSVDAEQLLRAAPAGEFNAAFLAELDRVVDTMLRNRLRVIVDLHPSDAYKQSLRTSESAVDGFAALWGTLARHYAQSDPERVFFEVMNEPEFTDRSQWAAVQLRAVQAIRERAPQHTIIAAAPNYSGVDDLLTLDTLPDNNIIYTFHDYEPFAFTHQGASWAADKVRVLRRVPYPSSPQGVTPLLELEPLLIDRHWLMSYGLDRWDAARIRAELSFAAQWRKVHQAPVYCGEFGAFRGSSDPVMRAAWLLDTRQALEAAHIGWAVWDYKGSFAVVQQRNGRSVADPVVADALGLQAQ